jgi:hypothetical protein
MKLLTLLSLAVSFSLHCGSPSCQDAAPQTIRLLQIGEDSTTNTITTYRLDANSRKVIRGQECYTSWREDRVHTTPLSKFVTVQYVDDGQIHRFGEPAKYRFELDHAPAMEQGLWWRGECLRSDRWITPTESQIGWQGVLEVDVAEMHRLIRELGVEL